MEAFVVADYIYSPLKSGSKENFWAVSEKQSAVKYLNFSKNTAFASVFEDLSEDSHFTRFENMAIKAVEGLLKVVDFSNGLETLVILSTTKGNVALLESPEANANNSEKLFLSYSAQKIQNYFKFQNEIQVVSNACISGVLSVGIAKRYLESGRCKNVLVIGADEFSPFIFSGFQAFHALSECRCKPFDENRDGINLGEAAVAMLLTNEMHHKIKYKVSGFGTANDANHISGPSRTAEGLVKSIQNTLKNNKIRPDFVNLHGTATIYNDEMESIALDRTNLTDLPVQSLKANFGHTLGASGVLEIALGMQQLEENLLLPSLGFESQGTSIRLNVLREKQSKALHSFLKTASGFGGCNAACLIEKIN